MEIILNPMGLAAAAAGTAALSGQAVGHTAQAAAAAAVVPPGVEEISAANTAKISAYGAEVAAVLGSAAGMQALYSLANAAAGTLTSLEDAATEVLFGSVL